MTLQQAESISLHREGGYRILVDFGTGSTMLMDEPEPVGEGKGPNAQRVLAAAIGNCLSASLLFSLAKSRVDVEGLTAEVSWELVRNDKGRMRIGSAHVTIRPKVGAEDREKLERCIGLFEDFCIVTQSVRQGFPVSVRVER